MIYNFQEIVEVSQHRQYSLAMSPVFLARVLHPKVLCQSDDIKTIIQISIDVKVKISLLCTVILCI